MENLLKTYEKFPHCNDYKVVEEGRKIPDAVIIPSELEWSNTTRMLLVYWISTAIVKILRFTHLFLNCMWSETGSNLKGSAILRILSNSLAPPSKNEKTLSEGNEEQILEHHPWLSE